MGKYLLNELNMPLTPRSPTAASLRALESGLCKIAVRGLDENLARAHARLARRSVLSMRRGVPLYHVSLADLSSGLGVVDVGRAVGWRFFVPGLRLGQSAEVQRIGRRYEMTSWIEGPDSRRFVELVDRLETEKCATRTYQLRCLEVPALHLMAVWAFRNATDQWFVPVSPLPVSMPSGRTFALSEFQEALKLNAVERLAGKPTRLPEPPAGA